MNWFSRQRRKHLLRKIANTLEENNYSSINELEIQLGELIHKFNDMISEDIDFKIEKAELFSEIWFSGNWMHTLISFMPVFNQQTNNDISTLLQSPKMCGDMHCLPNYLIMHPNTLNLLTNYLNFNNLASTVSTIICSCIASEQFAEYLFREQMVLSFVQYINSDTFEKATSAFKIFEELLLMHPVITSNYIIQQYQLYSISFKTILTSSYYLNKVMLLSLIFNLVACEECKTLLVLLMTDSHCLQLIIPLLRDNSKKIRQGAYNLFKLFVINPRKTSNVIKILNANKEPLIKAIRRINIQCDCPELIEERAAVIAILRTI